MGAAESGGPAFQSRTVTVPFLEAPPGDELDADGDECTFRSLRGSPTGPLVVTTALVGSPGAGPDAKGHVQHLTVTESAKRVAAGDVRQRLVRVGLKETLDRRAERACDGRRAVVVLHLVLTCLRHPRCRCFCMSAKLIVGFPSSFA